MASRTTTGLCSQKQRQISSSNFSREDEMTSHHHQGHDQQQQQQQQIPPLQPPLQPLPPRKDERTKKTLHPLHVVDQANNHNNKASSVFSTQTTTTTTTLNRNISSSSPSRNRVSSSSLLSLSTMSENIPSDSTNNNNNYTTQILNSSTTITTTLQGNTSNSNFEKDDQQKEMDHSRRQYHDTLNDAIPEKDSLQGSYDHGESCCEMLNDDDSEDENKPLSSPAYSISVTSFQAPPSLSTFVSSSREVYKRFLGIDMNGAFVIFVILLIVVVTSVLTLTNINKAASVKPISNSDQRSTNILAPSMDNLQNSVNTLSQFKELFNRADMVNPTNSSFAFSTFLSVASNEKLAFDYTVGVVTLFQSVISNTNTNYPFVVVVVPPRINQAKGLTESVIVKRTLLTISDIQNSLRPEELPRMRFVIASYISNPTEGKHAVANNVENRYIDTFNKLHMWTLDEFNFKRVIYFDADVVVLNPQIDTLFQCGHFCAVSDLCIPEFFNGGLMVLEPNAETYRDMIEKTRQPEYKSYDGGEQGFINRYFDFNTNSTAWPLGSLATRAKQQQGSDANLPYENFEEIARSRNVQSSVYRLPFNFNVQSQLALLSSIGWYKFASEAFDDGPIALHLVFPAKPWTFIGYPMLSPSYLWQTYFRKTALYRIVPWELLLLNLLLCCFAALIIIKQVGKIELPSLLLSNLFGNMIEDHVKHFKDGKESWKSYLFFNFMPVCVVIFSCLFCAYIYLALLMIQQYDPHVIWAMMILTSGSISTVILGLYTNVLSHATFLHFSKRTFSLKVGQNYNGKKYFVWLAGILLFGMIGCGSVFLFCMLTIGLFVLQIVYASLITFPFVILLYLKVLKPISHLTIIRTLQCLTKEGEKNTLFMNKLAV
nr:unnamed protein product [Naegleria fowleri]